MGRGNVATSGETGHLLETAACLRGGRADVRGCRGAVRGRRGDVRRNRSVSLEVGTPSGDGEAPFPDIAASSGDGVLSLETASCLWRRRAVVPGNRDGIRRRRSVSSDGGMMSPDIGTPSAEVAPSSADVATTYGEVASLSAATGCRPLTLRHFLGRLLQPERDLSQPREPRQPRNGPAPMEIRRSFDPRRGRSYSLGSPSSSPRGVRPGTSALA